MNLILKQYNNFLFNTFKLYVYTHLIFLVQVFSLAMAKCINCFIYKLDTSLLYLHTHSTLKLRKQLRAMDDTQTLDSFCKEQEDTLSLSSFPLQLNDSTNSQSNTRRSMTESEESDRFEFLIDEDLINRSGDIMCLADDIIINGKLLPCKLPPLKTPASVCRREEETKITNSVAFSDSPTKQKGKRTERSGGDFEKAVHVLRKNNALRPRSRWEFCMMLGVTRFPTEMELRDIRTRQLRRQRPATTLFTPCRENGDEKSPDQIHVVRRQCQWIGSWQLIKSSLSCKKPDADSVVVANASFPHPPPTKGRYFH